MGFNNSYLSEILQANDTSNYDERVTKKTFHIISNDSVTVYAQNQATMTVDVISCASNKCIR